MLHMIEISPRFTLLKGQILKVLEDKQPSNVNKNTKTQTHTPLPIYFAMKFRQIFHLQ
jgi:hypothetical protein